ncbi:MAG: hypothetical protein H0V14_09090 [Chitinophagaceae bacterium]|nr:hypothetical protein [Chitinophagaceae bacterium]
MGHIKEPEGVDFIINSRPLTKKEEVAISEYIRAYKAKHSHKQISTKQTGRRKTARKNVTA